VLVLSIRSSFFLGIALSKPKITGPGSGGQDYFWPLRPNSKSYPVSFPSANK
jgi:hypothetical protein